MWSELLPDALQLVKAETAHFQNFNFAKAFAGFLLWEQLSAFHFFSLLSWAEIFEDLNDLWNLEDRENL